MITYITQFSCRENQKVSDKHRKDNSIFSECLDHYLRNGREKDTPFVTFVLNSSCNFKCIYCGIGGEATISKSPEMNISELSFMLEKCFALGVEKIRFTGGEPFLYRNIIDAISIVAAAKKYLLVNTNGLLINRYIKDIFSKIDSSNLHIAVSLDTLKDEVFDKMSGTKNKLKKVLRNIELLNEYGLLMRINMVVSTLNYEEVEAMIEFCNDKKIDLKLQEITPVPIPFTEWHKIHYHLDIIEKKLALLANEIYIHDYSRSHGIPVKIFRINDSYITCKSLHAGSRYLAETLCAKCKNFPCPEGLYDVQVMPDRSIAICRWKIATNGNIASFKEDMTNVIHLFKSSMHRRIV